MLFVLSCNYKNIAEKTCMFHMSDQVPIQIKLGPKITTLVIVKLLLLPSATQPGNGNP